MNDVPLIRKTDVNDINTSLIAIKKQLKQLNEAVGLIDVPDVDLTPFVRKDEVVNVVESGNMNPITSNAVAEYTVDEVTSGNMNPVTSNAVANTLNYASSGTEINTGLKWMNGKTIYRKSYSLSIANAEQEFNHLINNLDTVIRMYGMVILSGDTMLPFGFVAGGGSYYFSGFCTSTKLKIRTVSGYTNSTANITLEYTKTTDTATRSIPTERSIEEPTEETR